MNKKTISGHYDTVYSLKHNNRIFVPKNVDVSRIPNNYFCVAAGQEVLPEKGRPEHISKFWDEYREMVGFYWEQRALYKQYEEDRYWEMLREMRKSFYLSYDPGVAFFQLLFLPMTFPFLVAEAVQYIQLKKELESMRFEQWVRDLRFKSDRDSARDALRAYDREYATTMLQDMDRLVHSMAIYDQDYNSVVLSEKHDELWEKPSLRFATVEEIYDKCFEPSFRRFQEKQRPCRRCEKTYLEQLRERQEKATKTKGSRTEKSRCVAEAIEIVFGIGDRDTTGYRMAPRDAEKSEALLRDFCDHVMEDPYLCCVTTKELDDPCWQPPFKHGLLVVNLVAHFDEETPGVHLTCIPYSRGCKRGPDAQASLGRAMAGMGYPSTWKEVLGEDGKPVPKRDRNGNIILNADGTKRYQQEPDKQGIVDWIEEQKGWIAREMEKRYGWAREYKGAHPRGHLSTPDYQVARAQERLEELQRAIEVSVHDYEIKTQSLTESLIRAASVNWEDALEREIILQYLMACPEEQYNKLVDEANLFLERLPFEEQAKAIKNFQETLLVAKKQADSQNKQQDKSPLQEVGR